MDELSIEEMAALYAKRRESRREYMREQARLAKLAREAGLG